MSKAEKPLFRDGLSAEFEQQQQGPYAPEPDEWHRTTVNPDLTIIERGYPGVWRYYVDLKGRLIAHLSQDHEAGMDISRWDIDYSDTKPLFTISVDSEHRRKPVVNVGFKSRGIKPKPGRSGLVFPQTTVKYKFLGERLEFDGTTSYHTAATQRSLTTGETVDIATQENGDSVTLLSRLESGLIEAIQLPQSIDFMWLSKVSNQRAVYDSSLPFLQWPAIFGAEFSLQHPEPLRP